MSVTNNLCVLFWVQYSHPQEVVLAAKAHYSAHLAEIWHVDSKYVSVCGINNHVWVW